MATTHLPSIGTLFSFAPPPVPRLRCRRYLHPSKGRFGHAPRHLERTPYTQLASSNHPQMGRDAPSKTPAKRSSGAVPVSSLLDSEPSTAVLSPRERMQISSASILWGSADTKAKEPERRPVYFDPARDSASRSEASSFSSSSKPYRGPAQPLSQTTATPEAAEEYGIYSSEPLRDDEFDIGRMRIKILQQPIAARACGLGERDRRVIDPPPILQLSLADFDPSSDTDVNKLKAQYNMVHCTLHEAPSRDNSLPVGKDVTVVPHQQNPELDTRRLMGNLMMSPFIGKDVRASDSTPENSRIGVYYIFHDISCRQNGLYRLVFTLAPVDPLSLIKGERTPIAAETISDVFEVFSAKDFPGMKESTWLAKELKRQGATVSVKKGSENKTNRKGQKKMAHSSHDSAELSDDEGDDEA